MKSPEKYLDERAEVAMEWRMLSNNIRLMK
jgi:hypothetical protein